MKHSRLTRDRDIWFLLRFHATTKITDYRLKRLARIAARLTRAKP